MLLCSYNVNTQRKTCKIKRCRITYSHIWRYMKMCVWIRYTFCKSFVKIYDTKRKCRSFLKYFLMQRTVMPTCPEKSPKNWKFLVDILGHYISWYKQKRKRRQMTDDRLNSGITDRQTFPRCIWNLLIHGPFWSRTFFRKSQKVCLHRLTIKVNQKPL